MGCLTHAESLLLRDLNLVINCPNPSCKTANPEDAEVCQVCQSVLPHYYLWGTGEPLSAIKANSLVSQRYLLKSNGIFLDTKPGLVPGSPPDLPDFLTAYLRLSAYPLHVPRVYTAMKTPEGDYLTLLESSALAASSSESATDKAGKVPELLPKLNSQWRKAPPLRQLNWLWQIAQLWEPFSQERAAATLLNADLLRVDGSIVRLLELELAAIADDPTQLPSLIDLGLQWRSLAETSSQAVRAFLERLCEQIERQQLTAEQLCERLSEAIAVCGQEQAVDYNLAVYTDQGPTRKRNEDACYPESSTAKAISAAQTRELPQLLIVCDGIGGHQGGDVASKLAIATIRAQLAPLTSADAPELSSTAVSLAIEEAICAANDEIAIQNDQAQRQARDRMGTTLVLALIKGADIYIAHLGDSRAYRVSYQNCQQVTLDDDVASRQVRLAAGLYREALTQPGSGSLIQALGMGPSQTLRPTVQRFVIDEDCLFLLCSDGLSDSDRVEQFWPTVLKPLVVESANSVAATGQQLVDLANKYNGHDNVTVGLIGARVALPSERMVPRELATRKSEAESAAAPVTSQPKMRRSTRTKTGLVSAEKTIEASKSPPTAARQTAKTGDAQGSDLTQLSSKPLSKTTAWGLKALSALAVLAGVGGLLYFLFPGMNYRFGSSVTSAPGGLASLDEKVETSAPAANASIDLSEGAYVRIRSASRAEPNAPAASTDQTAAPGINDSETLPAAPANQLLLYPNPEDGSSTNAVPYTISVGGVAQVVARRDLEGEQWVELLVCTPPPEQPVGVDAVPPLPEEARGWARSGDIEQFASGATDLPPEQLGSCEG